MLEKVYSSRLPYQNVEDGTHGTEFIRAPYYK